MLPYHGYGFTTTTLSQSQTIKGIFLHSLIQFLYVKKSCSNIRTKTYNLQNLESWGIVCFQGQQLIQESSNLFC